MSHRNSASQFVSGLRHLSSMASPRCPRLALAIVAAASALTACGGGGAASILVGSKDALLLLQVTTTNPLQAKPTGTLTVVDSAGAAVQTVALTVPTGLLSATASDGPSFLTHYSAKIDAANVAKGMKLRLSLAGGQLTREWSPRVGSANAMTLVGVPVQIAARTGQVSDLAAEAVRLRAPVAKVDFQERAVYTSSVASLPITEGEWGTAMSQVLVDLKALHRADGGSSSYYVGFVPKSTYGQTGLGYLPGNAVVVADLTPNESVVLETIVHEVGHNFSLMHAPCGSVTKPDASYPYANATLGAAGRYVWGYRFDQGTFVDPRNTRLHDLMSYCAGDTYSDYNYRRIQTYLTPADAYQVGVPVAQALVQVQ